MAADKSGNKHSCRTQDNDEYYMDDDDDDGDDMGMFMSRLSIQSFHGDDHGGYADVDADADGELSDHDKEEKEEEEEEEEEEEGKVILGGLSSDDDKEQQCYSLPATPPRLRRRGGLMSKRQHQQLKGLQVKEYASESDAQTTQRRRRRRGRRRGDRGSRREGGGGGGGLVVITRPKGGGKSLCMDLEEVKACRDLGFELEHHPTTLDINNSNSSTNMPTRLSISAASTTLFDTSSGGSSPVSNWRISSPGDDPKDVKARLRVWAQAVALVSSTSRHGC